MSKKWFLSLKEFHLNPCFHVSTYKRAVESLAECPSLMTHASVPDDQRDKLGIDDTLIRLSVGIESCKDLIKDLDDSLNAALSSLWSSFTQKVLDEH